MFAESNFQTKEVDLYENPAVGTSVTVGQDRCGAALVSGLLLPGLTISPSSPVTGPCSVSSPVRTHKVQYSGSNEATDVSDYEQVEVRYPRARQAKSIKGKVRPELLVVVDYFLFKKLNFDKDETLKYIVSFFNAVNLRFATINSPKVQLHIAGIIISESKASLSYITENIEKGNVIDAASTLHDMGRYFYKER